MTLTVGHALDTVNELLGFDGVVTFAERHIKGRMPDREDGGTTQCYLDASECERLSAAFAVLAAKLGEKR